MTLDVVVPTFNRSGLLRKALASLHAAQRPEGLQINVIVVDNNSDDDTADAVEQSRQHGGLPIVYVHESKQGLSNARNAGIDAGSAELIGFIDDDEEVGSDWFNVVRREFQDDSVSFIGGPYLGNWSEAAPAWLPPGYHAAIGVVPPKNRTAFDAEFGANLMGGNAVVRRRVFDQVGKYAPHLGRSGRGLLSEEDAEFYRRLEGAAMHGMYVPDLVIHHYIPRERLTRKYHRSWVFWRAVSQGVLDRGVKESSAYLFGVPRHRIGRAVRSAFTFLVQRVFLRAPGQAFAAELAVWDLFGFVYGRHFVDIARLYEPK